MIKESELSTEWESAIEALLSENQENLIRCKKLQQWARPNAADDIVQSIYNDLKS
jgi:UDP-N-acetylglucosamine:LPS N-acetylglucosamine transferase